MIHACPARISKCPSNCYFPHSLARFNNSAKHCRIDNSNADIYIYILFLFPYSLLYRPISLICMELETATLYSNTTNSFLYFQCALHLFSIHRDRVLINLSILLSFSSKCIFHASS